MMFSLSSIFVHHVNSVYVFVKVLAMTDMIHLSV